MKSLIVKAVLSALVIGGGLAIGMQVADILASVSAILGTASFN